MSAYECVAYTGHWCEFCGEDNGGGKFCYNCGQRESEDFEEEEEDGVWLDRCDRCDKRTASTLCPFTMEDKIKFKWFYYCVSCLDDNERYANPDDITEEDMEDDLFLALVAEAASENQDNFTERICENDDCRKEFHTYEPHYYDEEEGVCYCCVDCKA